MADPISDFYAIIPAGGIGSRLWPLSRADAPKFLHDLTGSGHQPILDGTHGRPPRSAAPRMTRRAQDDAAATR